MTRDAAPTPARHKQSKCLRTVIAILLGVAVSTAGAIASTMLQGDPLNAPCVTGEWKYIPDND